MAKINIVDDHSAEVKQALEAACHNALDIIGDKIAKYASELAPKDTGALANSITHQVNDSEKTVEIGSPLEYAPYQELGTGSKFTPPPEWIESHAQKGRGLESWVYQDEQGEWHRGYPIKGVHFLQRAVENHMSEFEEIVRSELKNA